MSDTTRRQFIQSTGIATGAAVAPMLWTSKAHAQWTNVPEKGAKLRVLRWSRFVQGELDAYLANVKKFTEKTGIEVRVDTEGWEDVRPKAAVAANTGAGADIILSTNDDANLYPDRLLDVTDLCTYLGNKYGGIGPKKFSGVTVLGWEQVGNYALRFNFSDGHRTGLYSFDYLRKLDGLV